MRGFDVRRSQRALLSAALSVIPNDKPPLELWKAAFALTYSAELRAEKKERGVNVVDQEPERYKRFFGPATGRDAPASPMAGPWRR